MRTTQIECGVFSEIDTSTFKLAKPNGYSFLLLSSCLSKWPNLMSPHHPGAFFHRLLNKLHFAKAHAKCNSSSQKGNLREWTQVWPISEISQANEPVLGPIPVYFGEAPKARSGTTCHDLSESWPSRAIIVKETERYLSSLIWINMCFLQDWSND